MGILNLLIGAILIIVTYNNEYYLFFELGWIMFSFLILTERKLIQIERSVTE